MTGDLHSSPFVGPGESADTGDASSLQRRGVVIWTVLTVLVFGIAASLAYRPSLSGMDLAVTIAAPVCAIGVVFGLVREVRPRLGTAATIATGVAIAAFGVLIFSDDEWSFVTFALYAAAFGCGPRLGIGFAFAISALWAAGWLADGAPPFAVAIPMAVFVVGSLLARTIYQVQVANERQAELIGQLADSRRELATVEHRKGMLEERARVSAEIHDTLAQGFTSIVLLSRSGLRAGHDLDVLRSIEATALDNLDAARRLVEASGPVELSSSTLVDALQEEVHDRFAGCSVEVHGEPTRIGDDHEAVLLRATQEGLTNAQTHGHADEVTVSLSYLPTSVCLDIRDNGHGFTPGEVADRGRLTGGQGLLSLRRRVDSLGGRLEVESQPGSGAVLSIQLPQSETGQL